VTATASDATRGDDVNPLVEIEHRVQARAKDLALDMGGPDGDAGLRALIDDEIRRWGDDFRRGLRPFDLATPDDLGQRRSTTWPATARSPRCSTTATSGRS